MPKLRIMKIINLIFILIFSVLLFCFSCTKPTNTTPAPTPTPTPPPPPQPPPPTSFVIDSRWECEVDGVKYRGSIDTSFFKVLSLGTDTLVQCFGTSDNKNANISFRLNVNRSSRPGPLTTNFFGFIMFDTASTRSLIASSNTVIDGVSVTYNIDTMASNKLKATFSGKLRLLPDNSLATGSTHTITNGKFSCEFGTGSKEPKYFSFSNGASNISGYFSVGMIKTNSLIMEGHPYDIGWGTSFRLQIRTGGTVKPGVYQAKNGDAGLHYYTPNIYPIYITDTLGDVSVTISSVVGNIVEGTFTGKNFDDKVVTGKFSCRIKDYRPQVDSINKWGFGYDESYFLYNMYGGNVLLTNLYQSSGRYYLSVNGESDLGDSKFRLLLSSSTPISNGDLFQFEGFPKRIDSLYFTSNTKLWNGNTTYLYAYRETYCKIEMIESKNVSATLLGSIRIRLSANAVTSAPIAKGKFRGSF